MNLQEKIKNLEGIREKIALTENNTKQHREALTKLVDEMVVLKKSYADALAELMVDLKVPGHKPVRKSTVRKVSCRPNKTKGPSTRGRILETLAAAKKKGMTFNDLSLKLKDKSKPVIGVTLAQLKKKKEVKRVDHTWFLAGK